MRRPEHVVAARDTARERVVGQLQAAGQAREHGDGAAFEREEQRLRRVAKLGDRVRPAVLRIARESGSAGRLGPPHVEELLQVGERRVLGVLFSEGREATLAARGLSGVRLSCQIACESDMTVELISRLEGSGRSDAGSPVADEIQPEPVWTTKS